MESIFSPLIIRKIMFLTVLQSNQLLMTIYCKIIKCKRICLIEPEIDADLRKIIYFGVLTDFF